MASPTHGERPVDLMMDLRERMVRIETKLDLKVEQDEAIATDLVALKLRTTTLETEGAILTSQIKTLKWLGAAAVTLVTLLGDTLSRFLS